MIDLDHWRRAQRLLPILLERHGLAFFLVSTSSPAPALHPGRVARAVDLAVEWIAVRSGRPVDACGRAHLERLFVELVQRRALSARRRS